MNTKSSLAISMDVLSLPEIATTLNDHEFNPNDHMWRIPDSSRDFYFNFSMIQPFCSHDLLLSLKKVCMWFLKNMSASHSFNNFNRFKSMVLELMDEGEQLNSIAGYHVLNYAGSLNKEHECYLGALSSLLKKWSNLGYPGVEADVVKVFSMMKIKKNRGGYAVLTMDPEEGPFLETELQTIHRSLNSAYSKGELRTKEFALVWLFMATGARPVQLADVHISDFKKVTSENILKYWISIPRAKQRRMKRRAEFKNRPLATEVGVLLEAWIAQVKEEALVHAPDMDPGDLPIFPMWDNNHGNEDFLFQTNGQALGNIIKGIFSKVIVHSYRTREPMKVTPRRFRHTLGTRAAMEKQGLLVIAELLDHSTTYSTMVYTKATPEIIDKLDEALATVFGNLAQAFAGKIVLDNFDTGRPEATSKIIRIPGLDSADANVGQCATCIGCNARVPYACYVCPHFHAWLYGPHDQVLKELLIDRRNKLETTDDKTFAYANDHVIQAVAHALDKCKRRKAEMES